MNVLKTLQDKNLITPPEWLPNSVHWLVTMGSVAYGVATDYSDFDVYGFAVPPKRYIFPHTEGYIDGFGKTAPKFDQYTQAHIMDKDALGGKGREYDFSVYNIVKYFNLCMDGNPNMVDSLFVPRDCVLHSSKMGEHVYENRHLFLSKKMFPKFKGYSFAQIHKMKNKQRKGKRQESIDKWGYDVKFAYHVIRLLTEMEYILIYEDLDLRSNSDQLKSIRRGEYTEQDIYDIADDKLKTLEQLYPNSTLQNKPDEGKIKTLLMDVLEDHYGSLEDMVGQEDKYMKMIKEIRQIIK